ncbi:hypothetical protein [Eleftheria terrae]|uniref:hypothetical protein n=1 Tax=Eleftheria terrae TaxID=1597781 RepID=UPI00263B0317|nr:hypothetical protein [Eleftheria terrae]WKB53009.1 hypothetical protein N7L95_00980 [Eleftheria terrae]
MTERNRVDEARAELFRIREHLRQLKAEERESVQAKARFLRGCVGQAAQGPGGQRLAYVAMLLVCAEIGLEVMEAREGKATG